MDDLNVLMIGDPHIMDSATREVEELTSKLSLMINSVNSGAVSFEGLDGFFKGGDVTDIPAISERISDKFDIAVIMGDVLDRHGTCSVYSHKRAVELFEVISAQIPLFVIIGNHDRPYNSDFLSDYHFFSGLKDKKNLYIIDKAKVYNIIKDTSGVTVTETCEGEKGLFFLFVPYVPNGKFTEAIDTIKNLNISKLACVLAHQELYKCRYNGITSEKGDKIQDNFPLIISGHIHEYQKLKGAIYVGSSRQINRSESPDKTVSLFKFKNNDGIPKDPEELRINMNLIRKINMKIRVSQLHTVVVPDNCVLYLVIEGTKSEIKSLKKLATFKPIIENKNIKVYYNADLTEDTILDETQRLSIKSNISFIEKLKIRIKNSEEQLNLLQELFT